MANYLFDFEGIDGDATWVEPAGPDPSYIDSCEIDTDQFYAGSSSLKLLSYGSINYGLDVELPVNFNNTFYFRYVTVNYRITLMSLSANYGATSSLIRIRLDRYLGHDALSILVVDTSSNFLINYHASESLSPNTWHKAEIIVEGKDISIKIDDVEIAHGTAIIENPFGGTNYFYINNQSNNDVWIDALSFENTGTSSIDANLASVLTGIASDIELERAFSSLEVLSALEGISSNIEIFNGEVLEDVDVQFFLAAIAYEYIPVICEWNKGKWEIIKMLFELKNTDHYNFNYVSVLFQVASSNIVETMPVIFSIIKQPQSFDSYVMQKLYCVTTNYSGNDLCLLDWNVLPNQTWYVVVNENQVTLYETQEDMEASTNPVAEGTANADLTVHLSYVDEYEGDVGLYYQDILYHLALSAIVFGKMKFKVKPLTDMSEIRDPIYNNSNIVLSRGEAELNLHTYTVLGKDITLATHFPEIEVGENVKFVSTRRKTTKIGQILSHTIEGSLGSDGESSLINVIKTAEYMELSR